MFRHLANRSSQIVSNWTPADCTAHHLVRRRSAVGALPVWRHTLCSHQPLNCYRLCLAMLAEAGLFVAVKVRNPIEAPNWDWRVNEIRDDFQCHADALVL